MSKPPPSAPSAGSGSPPPPSPGSTLSDRVGPYKCRVLLGTGSFGDVFLAEGGDPPITVALKCLRNTQAVFGSEGVSAGGVFARDVEERFDREADILKKLDHPNVVKVYGAGRAGGVRFIAMEYLSGNSLGALLHSSEGSGLRKSPDGLCRLAGYVAQAGRGVAYLHQQGVIHRDIKPWNVMRHRPGATGAGEEVVKLIDFGLSKPIYGPSMTPTGLNIGTPAYMPPELVGRGAAANEASDVYSLGATLYELITGGRPYGVADRDEVLDRLVRMSPVPPRGLNRTIPRDLDTICQRAMAWRPEDRYPDVGAMVADLESFVEGKLVRGPHPSLAERLKNWGARKKNHIYQVGAITTVVVGLLVILYVESGRRNEAEGREQAERRERRQSELRAEAEADLAEEARKQEHEVRLVTATERRDRGIERAEKGDIAGGVLVLADALGRCPTAGDGAEELERSIRLQIGAWSAHLHPLIAVLPRYAPDRSHTATSLTCATFRQEGNLLITVAEDDRKVHFWRADTGARARPPFPATGDRRVHGISTDGRLAVTTTRTKTSGTAVACWAIDARQEKQAGPPLALDHDVIELSVSSDARTGWALDRTGCEWFWDG